MEKINILLVDDNANNLIALSAVLNDPVYNLVFASSGPMALELLRKDEFALVLLDVMMPGMDGFEVASQMKKDEALREIPILFVSAIATDLAQIFRGYQIGGVDYIVKPLEPDMVRARVGVFVELFKQKKEIQRKSELIRESDRARALEREKAARLRAEEAEQRFRNLVNALDHAIIWEATPDLSHFYFISDRVTGLLGYPVEQWLNQTGFFLKHVLSEDQTKLLTCVENIAAGEKNSLGERCEHRMVTADGAVRWFHTGLQGERDSFGRVMRLRGLCVDITPLKKVEERLRAAIHARDEIVSIVAHDLRAPLSAAGLGASLLTTATEKQDIGELKKVAESVKRAISYTLKLADNILDAERIETQGISIQSAEWASGDIVNEAVAILRPLAEQKSIQIYADVTRAPVIHCDRERILQVFSNLIGNAVKFSPPNSAIRIAGEIHDGQAHFSVKDAGPGIASDQINKVFERYWQLKDHGDIGVGLGLAICKGVIDAHGGKIWVESQVGEGSTFHFTCPILPPAQPANGWHALG